MTIAGDASQALSSKDDEVRARLAAIVDSSDDAILSKDLNGIILSWNAGAQRIFGYTAEETIGKPVTLLMPPERFNEEPGILLRIRSGERVDHYETIRKRKDGSLLDVSLTISPIVDTSGRVIGASKIARDITERKRNEAALSQAKEAAEAANRSKDRFLAVLSHELRTPLTPVLMTVAALEHHETLPVEVRDDLSMIKRNIELEVRLIDDLLDITRISSGKLELNLETVDLNEIVHQVCGICSPDIISRDLRFEKTFSPEAANVSADKVRLQQALWNVLRNALKFTPDGGSIHLSTSRLPDDRCEVRVSDSGIGIPEENLPHIFEAFEQGGKRMTRHFGGLGLGLAISKSIVEMHGGRIYAESKGQDQGATFVIELPVTTAVQENVPPLSSPQSNGASKSVRILLVEDHPDTARILFRLLSRAGFSVILASDAATARDAAEREEFDILVSDLGLPDGSGYEIMNFVRTTRGLPGIVMSGYGTEDDRRRTREAGFSEHLVKPIDMGQLIGAIGRVTADRC